MGAEFSVHYHVRYVYKVLKHLEFSWITSYSKHPKQPQKTKRF
ncbi:winged helix-turn-helix domain-containing protein [Pseudoalteromonas aliena]